MTTVEFLKSPEFWLQMIAPGSALLMAAIALVWARHGGKHQSRNLSKHG
jgi:hypothetical protein